MNWIVTWVIVTHFLVACPQPDIVPDKFGVIPLRNTYNLMSCLETKRKPMKKEFAAREDAEEFIKEGRKKYTENLDGYGQDAMITDWKLLEAKVCYYEGELGRIKRMPQLIKFRAWDKEYEKMTIVYTLDELLANAHPLHKAVKDDYIWMQFTGFFDKTGKEIYEGDIVRQKKTTGAMFKVIWDIQDGQWFVDPVDKQQGWDVDHLWRWAKVSEVIGNIYETPNPT